MLGIRGKRLLNEAFMTGKESFLVDIAQMKAVANRLFREEKIGEAEYQAINRQLDALLIEEVSGLAEKQPSVLADDLTRRYPNLDLESLTQLLWLGHSDQILGPREEALRAGLPFLDLSEYFPGFDRIPLTPFLWRHVHFEFRNLCQLLANPEVSFDKAVAASRSFFCFEKGLHAPTGFPDLSNRIINRLLNENRILPAQAQALAEDLDTIFACLDENRAHLHQAFFQETIEPAAFFAHGELAFNLLMDRLFAAGPVDEVLLDRLVIQWPGPGFIDLVAPWLKRGREREKAPLILARTGLDPIRQEKAWRDWLQKQNNHEKLRYRLFENNLNAQKTLYETAFVLACGDLLGDKLETIWWPALRPEREEAESVEAIETAALPAEPAPSPEKIEKTEPDSFLPEDDADQLSAPPLTASSEDLLVEKHSAWRSTLKPFLSENWMGMLGAFSLLAAWLFFSLYFWGAGTIFRLLVAGALPLSLFTLGAGLAARLIAHRRDRGASPRAATLFAILCLGSAPFNFMIAYALMGVASPWGFGLGLALGLAQIGIVFLVSKWCRPVFGVSHFRFLLLQSLLLLFPFLAARFGPGWTPLAMNAVLFVAGMILFLEVLGRVKNEDPNYPLNWKMLSGYYLLVLVVMHLYFKATPGPVALSAWLQCLALGIGFFGRGQTSATLVGAGLSVLGNAIAFQAPIGLPLSLALATVFWLRQKKQRETAWLNEVVLVHLAGLALVGLYLGQVSWAWVAPALLPVLLAGVLIERKPGEKEIQLISLGLPFLLAGFVGLTDTETFFTATLLPLTLILATGIYAYVRYVRWFRTGPWLITMLIIPFLGLACMPFPMLSKWTALYMGGAAVLWALVSRRLPDALNRRHGAGLLLFTALAAAAFQFAYLLANPDSPIPVSLGLILTLAAFYVAARRFRSSLPIYLGLGLILVWGQQLRAGWGFHGRSGLATAVCAWLFLAAAAWLDRRKPVAEVESPDLFFNKPFLLQTDRYLAKPMETVALLLAFASLVKTILWFAPFSQNIKLGVALLANIPLFAVLALMRRNRLLGALIAVPALMLLVAAAWSAPLEVRPFYVGLFLLMSTAILDRLEKRERLKPIYSPLKIICQVLVLFSIALGFMAYAFYVQFEGMGLNLPATERGFYAMGYGLMAIVVTHLLVVRRFSGFASHLVLIHILICCCFYHVLFTNGLSVDGLLFRVLASFIGLTALLAYIAEFYRTKASAPYLRAARIWLPAIGFGAASIALAQRFLPQSSPSFLVAAAAYCLLHLANRYGAHRILLLLKSLVAWLFISFFVQDLLLSLMLAILLFSLVEWLLAETNRWPMLRIQGYMLEKADVARRTTLIVALLSVGFLVMHLFVFFAEPRGFLTTPHYLLWILIPYAHYFKRTFGHAFFAYAAIGLFAYATAFIFWGAPLPEAWGLTPLHGLNLGLVLAIGCYDAIGRLSRKRGLTEFANRVENTNVLITSIIIFSATLSFVTAHQLEAPFQARFLVSAVLLGLTASFLRWGPRRIETVHRALYRIATTMMLWSIGLYFAPYQSWILYLILAPGLFFLFRIEVKAAKSQREDLAAAGILFALTVFLFVQLQPLQLLLFPDEAFHWNRYYLDAPVLMIAGLGLMRLHKHATWPGLCLLGSILAAAGAVLTLSGLLHPYLGRYSESLVLAVVAHLGLMVIFIRNPLYRLFVRFTGLRSHERNGYRTQFFWLANIALQANLVFLLLFPTYLWWVMVLLPVCVSGLLYWYKARTLAPAFIETGVLAFPSLSGFFRPFHRCFWFRFWRALFWVTPIFVERPDSANYWRIRPSSFWFCFTWSWSFRSILYRPWAWSCSRFR